MAGAPLRVWVTRARPGADATAERLRALGYEPVVAPLLEVRPLTDVHLDLDGVGALAFSSANGVAAFAALTERRDFVAYAVGGATGEAARAAGFADVRAGDADVTALAQMIADDRKRPAGVLLHIAPAEPAGDLVGQLATAAVGARRAALYETVTTDVATPEAIDTVLIHSPKAARVLAARAEHLEATAVQVLALSDACAVPIRSVGFARIKVANTPTESDLLAILRP